MLKAAGMPQHPTEYGGQGLPKTIMACGEMLNSANMSFALCLSDGAIEAL
jgi:alkylation response protein AidB-like acyl-CoA dehydrogenase